MLSRVAVLCLSFVAAVLSATLAEARCTGPSLMERLSDPQRDALATAIADTPYARGLLWSAERDGQRLTVVGTMHIFHEGHAAIIERLAPVMDEVDLVLLEMTSAEEEQMQEAMTNDPSLMFLTDGPTLPEILDEETWQALADALRAREIPPFMGAKFQPWFLMLTLSMPACAMDYLFAGDLGLDGMIMDLADSRSVPMQALEAWDTLFVLFQEESLEEQIDYLRISVLQPEDLAEEMFVAMIDSYFSGEIAEIWELSRIALDFAVGMEPDEAEALFEMTEEALLNRRNNDWIPVIEAAAATHGHVMVAAGAAHMPGEQGVLRLLEEQGWTIRPLP